MSYSPGARAAVRPNRRPVMSAEQDPPAGPVAPEDKAFELWLRQGLQRLHGAILEEPLPPELLRLIEEDRSRQRCRDR